MVSLQPLGCWKDERVGIWDHSSSRLNKIRYNPVSQKCVCENSMEKARCLKIESVLEGEMDMFAFQVVAGM